VPDNNKWTVVGLGEILWDMLPGGKVLGGAPANFAYHARVLGARAAVASCVGNDTLGGEILEQLQRLGLGSRYVATSDQHPTGTVDVQLDADGRPTYVIHEDVAWDHIPLSDELLDLAGRADAVCFGSLCQRSPASRRTITSFLEATRPDCLRVFDVNLRQHYYDAETLRQSLEMATVVKLNDEEMPVLAGLLRIAPARAETLLNESVQLVALTMGPKGSMLSSHGGRSIVPGATVEVADTVGAGDAFTAALVIGLLNGCDLDTINRAATRLAAFVCSQPGATPLVPHDLLTELF